MGKIWMEVCIISGRGLRRTSSLWKLQWYAVGWIDPTNKYCTNIDASGNANPVWKTKFSTLIDTCEVNFQQLVLNVQVYSREPIFLREKLMGTATVALKEFVDKYAIKDSQILKPIEEVGSFQLRANNSSNKPQGFIDISIRVSPETQQPITHPGDHQGFKLDSSNGPTLPNQFGPSKTYNPQMPPTSNQKPEIHLQPRYQYTNPVPFLASYSSPSVAGPSYEPQSGRSHQPPRTPPPPPPPPPPANVGYIPTFLPRTSNLPPSYVNMPSSGAAPGHGKGPGFAMGVGAGALAAGAVIVGDDFMRGFHFPGGIQDASVHISTDPPF